MTCYVSLSKLVASPDIKLNDTGAILRAFDEVIRIYISTTGVRPYKMGKSQPAYKSEDIAMDTERIYDVASAHQITRVENAYALLRFAMCDTRTRTRKYAVAHNTEHVT